MFPKNKRKHKIGMPPVDDELVYSGRFFPASSSSSCDRETSANQSSAFAVTEDDWISLLCGLER